MKISTEWLQEYLGAKVSPKKLAEAIELAGIELEQFIDAKNYDDKIVIGHVKKVIQHPDADRLRLAEVDSGDGTVELVCGAPNLRMGQKVALAKIGAVLPDGTMIERAIIRGQVSNGMICSARELGMGDDHSGIMEFEASIGVGTKLCDVVETTAIVDIKTHANRADLQSVVGVAREVAAVNGVSLKEPAEATWPGSGEGPEIQNLIPTKVTRYMAGDLVAGLEHETPDWMKQRLKASGVRPINVVVDVTNYVMLELGQPLHAFDASKVKLPIVVRMAKKDETFVTLDGVERRLVAEDIVIADSNGPIALAGVMGGQASSVTAETKRILLESATFDGPTIRKTAQRHGLRTEASGRYERRLPVQLAPLAIKRAAALLIELAGAKASGGLTDRLEIWPWVQHVGARSSRLSELFGAKLTRETIAKNLQKLGFEAEPFDVAAEARKHLGKPYVWGAKFKTHGAAAFDCGYLIDYIYSLIDVPVGHTAPQIVEFGRPVHSGELLAGDILYRDGPWEKLNAKDRNNVSHAYLYLGNKLMIHAKDRERNSKGDWVVIDKPQVAEEAVELALKDPQYLGAIRLVDSLDDYVAITVPWWRPDVKTEQDVLEEVARMVGYDSLKPTLPIWQPTAIETDKRWPRIWQVKAAMRGLGLFEVMTYSFVSGQQLDEFGNDRSKHLKLRNAMSVEQEYLRSDLLASLLGAVGRNVGYGREFGLFETSKVFVSKGAAKLPDEPTRLGVIVRKLKDGYWAAKQALDLLARELQIEFEVKPGLHNGLHPARSATVRAAGKLIGVIGEVHPDNLRRYKVSGSLGYLEVDLDELIRLAMEPRYSPTSKFPTIVRDLSLELGDRTGWAEVRRLISDSGLAKVEYLNEYLGPELPAGRKGMAVRLEMSSMERTLTDEEADRVVAQIMKKLEKSLRAKLRVNKH